MRDPEVELPDIKPRPDPTLLTTAALKQSIENLKEFLISRIASGEALLDAKINHNYLMDEKRHRETREWFGYGRDHRMEVKADAEKALERAFSAAKELTDQQRKCNEEAASKAESAFHEQLNAWKSEANVAREAMSSRLDELKERLDRGTGKEEYQTKTQGWLIPMIVVGAIAFGSLIVNLLQLFKH